ncbi:amino acid permease [Massilibacteroides sp.]|uniref:amino acid permease n=1 Tax=Massilibacteroides sp. TaxID=2034766 RepID=UPI00262DB847|nr:amino acid permease [Massilibacteroides sp.]MDD4514958.1 amino acid permease [Massilibacteroides sp.]
MRSDWFRIKNVEDLVDNSKNNELKRTLTATNLIALGIGCIIGTGIFVLTGTAAANHAGPALTISFIISALGCVMAGLCYAEFAAMIPVSGSAYSYSYASLGEFIAWFIGWDLILEYLFASATVSVGWSGYVVSFLADFGIHIPAYLAHAPFDHIAGEGWIMTGSIINFPAMFIVLIVTSLLIVGIKESASANDFIVVIKLAVILLFIGFGIAYVNTENWVPYIPENTGKFGEFGWSGILTGAGVIFFAYIGFDAVSTVAQETKNPQKDMPKGILGSLLICTVLYILVTAVLTGIVHYTELNVPAPIALAIDRTSEGLAWLASFIKIGAIAGLSSVVLVMLLGQSRIFYSMSKDGLLPPIFSKVHSKHKTPHITTIITGSISAIIAGLFPINILGELVSIGTLMAFTIVCISVLVLRKQQPNINRPFKTPWVPFVPIAGALICIAQMIALPFDTWLRLIVWMLIGLVLYIFYGSKHSKLNVK